MAKQVDSYTNQITSQMRAHLDEVNFTTADIDKLLQKLPTDELFSQLNLIQYFRIAHAGYKNLTDSFSPNHNKALRAAGPDPADYLEYWDKKNDPTVYGVPFFDYIPGQYFKDPSLFRRDGFNPAEVAELHTLFNYGSQGPKAMAYSQQGPGGGSPGGTGTGGGTTFGGGPHKMMSTGSQTKNLGPPPPPPGNSGYPPPPPPMGGENPGGGYMADSVGNWTPNEQAWIQANLQNTVGAGWWPSLLFVENQRRYVAMAGMEEYEKIRATKMEILQQMQGLGNDPASSRKMFELTQKMQMLSSDEQMIMDKIMRGSRAADELKGLIKGIFDKENENIMALIRNTRPGG